MDSPGGIFQGTLASLRDYLAHRFAVYASTSMSESPDRSSAGLLSATPRALRYDGHTDDPHEGAALIRSFIPSRSRVLDVGCGTGSVSLIANRDKGNTVVGIEPDAERAQLARARGLSVFCGYLSPEFIASEPPFDVVLMADVLEHVPDPGALVALAHSALKPGGTLVVSVPNAVHWIMRWQIFSGKFEYDACGIRDATHLRWFTRATLRQLLEQHGFVITAAKASAGTDAPEYFTWRPWRWAPVRFRSVCVRHLSAIWPSLFGYQWVIQARKP